MKITTNKLSKRFQFEWVFKDLDYVFESLKSYAITGPNGSGKSTLLQIISGQSPPSKGDIEFTAGDKEVHKDDVYKKISFASPYMELIEEMTLSEHLHFHFKLKKARQSFDQEQALKDAGISEAINKQVVYFSSGMKQRLKLMLAFYSDAEVIFLDEPTTNLDDRGKEWYQTELEKVKGKATVIIASNEKDEYRGVDEILNLKDYK